MFLFLHFDHDFKRFECNVFYDDLHSLFTLVIFARVCREGPFTFFSCFIFLWGKTPQEIDGFVEVVDRPNDRWFLRFQKGVWLFDRSAVRELAAAGDL